MTHTKTQDRPFYIAWIFSAMVITVLFIFIGCNTIDANYPGSSSGCADKDPDDVSLYECGNQDDGETVNPNIRKINPQVE